MAVTPHADATSIHKGAYVQSSDPGAVGADKLWVDTTGSAPFQLKRRNSTDSGWENVGIIGAITDAQISATAEIAVSKLADGDALALLRTDAAGTGVEWATPGQIAFPATQAASADANTLDDYEEGTFTPTIGGTGGESGQVYSSQSGAYIKIGKLVFFRIRIVLSTLGTITGAVVIKGLPFTVEAAYGGASIGYYTAMTSAFVNLTAMPSASSTFCEVMGATAASTGLTARVQGDLSNTTEIRVSGMYIATA